MAISKQQWLENVKIFATDSMINSAKSRVEEIAKVRTSAYDPNGMDEDKLLGHDPVLDDMIAKHRANLSAFWGGRAVIAQYLQMKLEPKPKK